MSLLTMPDWDNMFTMILFHCDFRTILTLNCTCKLFIGLCQKERRRRLRVYSICPQKFESPNSYFYASKCAGILIQFQYTEDGEGKIHDKFGHDQIRLDCGKYCYVSEIKDRFCKTCNLISTEIEQEQRILADEYSKQEKADGHLLNYSKLSAIRILELQREHSRKFAPLREETLIRSKPTKFLSKQNKQSK